MKKFLSKFLISFFITEKPLAFSKLETVSQYFIFQGFLKIKYLIHYPRDLKKDITLTNLFKQYPLFLAAHSQYQSNVIWYLRPENKKKFQLYLSIGAYRGRFFAEKTVRQRRCGAFIKNVERNSSIYHNVIPRENNQGPGNGVSLWFYWHESWSLILTLPVNVQNYSSHWNHSHLRRKNSIIINYSITPTLV